MDDNKALERASERMSTDSLELYCRNLSKAKNDLTKYDRALLLDVSDRLCELQSALEQTEPPNDPLTLEELRGMDGEPVWVEFVGKPDGSPIPPLWMLVDVRSKQLVTGTEFVDWREESWLAYRRKPDGGGE